MFLNSIQHTSVLFLLLLLLKSLLLYLIFRFWTSNNHKSFCREANISSSGFILFYLCTYSVVATTTDSLFTHLLVLLLHQVPFRISATATIKKVYCAVCYLLCCFQFVHFPPTGISTYISLAWLSSAEVEISQKEKFTSGAQLSPDALT